MADKKEVNQEKKPEEKAPGSQPGVKLDAGRNLKVGPEAEIIGGSKVTISGGAAPPVIPPSQGGVDAKAKGDIINDGKIIGGNDIHLDSNQQAKGASGGAKERFSSSWANGSFYLFAFVVIVALFAYLSRFSGAGILALIAVIGLLAVPVIGAFQLKMDKRLGDKSFVELMKIVLEQLPLIGKLVK